MSILTGDNPFADYKKELEEKKGPCWTGYKKVPGKKDYEDDSCVKESECKCEGDCDCQIEEDSKGHKRSTESGAGLTKKGVAAYRRENPGSKLKTAVTTPPSKMDPDSKPAKRRKSFCARSKSWNGERGKAARRRWNC